MNAAPPPPSRLHTVAGIAGLSFGTALVVLDGGIANVALPTIARDLHVDASAAVLVVTVYQLVLVMALLPLSAVGDRIGLRRLYQLGQLLFAAASALAFFAHSLPFLLVVRMVQALGAAAALSVTSAMLRQLYPPQRLGRGLGFNSVVVSASAALAPTAGGLILSFAGWPWLFAAATPLAMLSLALGRFLPNPPAAAGAVRLHRRATVCRNLRVGRRRAGERRPRRLAGGLGRHCRDRRRAGGGPGPKPAPGAAAGTAGRPAR